MHNFSGGMMTGYLTKDTGCHSYSFNYIIILKDIKFMIGNTGK
jgi:hypothetical protein